MKEHFGNILREDLYKEKIIPFIGAYDVFSASIVAKYFNGIFVSGFSFAASHYGLPDVGFITWTDIVAFTQRVRTILPGHHILVDIDDGYCDTEVACHVVRLLESIGASGVVLEDQLRPRQCGHLDGKQIMPLDQYLHKLNKVLKTRRSLFVVARTDSTQSSEALTRARAFAAAGADAIMVEAVKDLDLILELRNTVDCPIVFNQIVGGKSPLASLSQLQQAGVSLVNYSTPCLFAAQTAVDEQMRLLRKTDGLLPDTQEGGTNLQRCTAFLNENLKRIGN